MHLQAELAFIQARLSILHRIPPSPPVPQPDHLLSSSEFMGVVPLQHDVSIEEASFCDNNLMDRELEDGDLHTLDQEFVSTFLPGAKARDPSSS